MSRIGPTSLRLEPLYIKVRPPLVLSPLFFDRGHWEALQGYVLRHSFSLPLPLPSKQDHLRMNDSTGLNNHLSSIDRFDSLFSTAGALVVVTV